MSVDGIQNSLEGKKYEDELFTKIKNNFSLSEYEVGVLKTIVNELKKPFPITSNGLESRINTLEGLRVELLNILQVTSDKLSTTEYEYKKLFDPKFVQLTRSGRPNQQAVDSEIHIDPIMYDKRLVLNNYNNFKSLLFGYLKSIDLVRETSLTKWRMRD